MSGPIGADVLAATGRVLAADPARTAGLVVGRLLLIALAVYLLVTGVQRRSRPGGSGRGVVRIVIGVLLVLGLLGNLAQAAGSSA